MLTTSRANQILRVKTKSNRAEWIDIVRGVTMLLVVYSHVCSSSSSLNSIFLTTRMPLFFFISGFFMYSVEYNAQLIWRRTKNRICKQLYPTIIIFSIFIIAFYNHDFSYIFHEYKIGYWFTYVSVLYFFTLVPILYLFTKYKIRSKVRIIVFVFLMVSTLILHHLIVQHTSFLTSKLSGLLSFDHYISYFRYLICGCVFRIFWNKYNAQLMNWVGFIVCAAYFIVSICVGGILSLFTAFAGIYVMLFTFYKLSNYFFKHITFRAFSFVGSMTLEIYLLHYFLLSFKEIPGIRHLINSTTNTLWEFPVVATASILIILFCLLIVWLLRSIKIYPLLFGKNN
ncbi:MAG: acyltransferase [Bacteroidales bacterium]|nr:acyltransferase [Bacteroidales bacterium]